MNINSLPWIFILIFFFTLYPLPLSLSDPRTFEAGLICGNSSAGAGKGTRFVPAFVKDMEYLSQLMTTRHFATHTILTNSSISVYALSQCHQDLSQTDCLLCFAASRTKLPRCLPNPSARIFFDGCFLRYDTYRFFEEATDPMRDSASCNSSLGTVDEAAMPDFVENVGYAVGNVTGIAGSGKGFGTAEVKGVYALAQCWRSLSIDSCRVCLEKAGKEAKSCVPSRDGRGLNAGCYLRYSTEKFYNDNGESQATNGSSATGITVTVVLVASTFTMLCLFAAYAGYSRISKIRQEGAGKVHLRQISIGIDRPSLNFKYEILEKATDFFDPSRKIGQGGTGSVYRGTLPDGKIVAVKRLVFNTRQWVDEFFNEVNLISGIQHKNLVKLLGCSIEGPESLLVYDFVVNKSLDHYLFDKNKTDILSWKQRFNIIVGTAEGLAHLHGGCRVKIIHRDIKSSNVLLDENFMPKIADFGLVRCFGTDISHLSTGIAGTLGYMAPEYVVRGQLTEKADVYSFGVLVLEIACGRRNTAFVRDSSSLLQMVWKLYKSNSLMEAIDPRLKGDFPEEEAANVLQIGLLCTQASAADRPLMAQVIQLLRQEEPEIPEPNQPPFMAASSRSLELNSSICSSNGSLMSSVVPKTEATYTSSETSVTTARGSDRQSVQE